MIGEGNLKCPKCGIKMLSFWDEFEAAYDPENDVIKVTITCTAGDCGELAFIYDIPIGELKEAPIQFLEEYEQRASEEAMRFEEIENCQHDNIDHGICTNCEQAV
jgi:hypothetical protein